MALLCLWQACKNESPRARQPNIIYILIDDLGYADLGCYGNSKNQTPNIDRLAAEGMRFTDFHSNGPMCTPTRAALMTGNYQYRYGKMFEGPLSGKTQRDKGLPLEAVTIAEVLKEAGYVTGMYGKWHLGYEPPFLPTSQGFDDFRGLGSGDGDHHTHINRWGAEDWWFNNEISMEDGYTADLITDHSLQFIVSHRHEPFFLFISHLAIHFPWQGPQDRPHRIKGNDYTDDKWGIIDDRNNVHHHVKSMLQAVDDGLGSMMDLLKTLDLDKNTLVVFASDNGGYIHYDHQFHHISNNGPLRGQKGDVYEGGHRVPCIARWPDKIDPGSTSDQLVMTMDMFPTFAALAGLKSTKLPPVDGIDISEHLLEKKALPDRTVCWKIDNEKAIRRGPWKLCLIGQQPPQLYNLKADISEEEDLSEENREVVQQLVHEYMKWEQAVTASYKESGN